MDRRDRQLVEMEERIKMLSDKITELEDELEKISEASKVAT